MQCLLTVSYWFYSIYSRYKIRIGGSNHALPKTNNTIELDILNQFIHPNYDGKASYYDVAILETSSVTLSAAISPVCLPEKANEDNKYDNYYVELTGWGQNNLHSNVSNQLRRVALKIHPLRFVFILACTAHSLCVSVKLVQW